MKKIFTLFTVLLATYTVNAQSSSLKVADIVGHWKFAGKATSSLHEVQNNSGFEYIFNSNNTVSYLSGEVRPFVIKGDNIAITDKAGNVSNVHVVKVGNGEMTVITEYNTPSASAPIVFKKVN